MAQAVKKAAEKSKELLKDGYKAASSALDSIKRKSFYDQFHVFAKNEVNQNDSKIRERCAKLAEDLVLNNKEEFIAICIEKKIQKQQERTANRHESGASNAESIRNEHELDIVDGPKNPETLTFLTEDEEKANRHLSNRSVLRKECNREVADQGLYSDEELIDECYERKRKQLLKEFKTQEERGETKLDERSGKLGRQIDELRKHFPTQYEESLTNCEPKFLRRTRNGTEKS